MFTTTFLVKRRKDLRFDAFRRHSREAHAPLVAALPGLRRYVVSFYRSGGDADAAFDASAVLDSDDAMAFDTALRSPEGAAALADRRNFLEPAETVVLAGEVGATQAAGDGAGPFDGGRRRAR